MGDNSQAKIVDHPLWARWLRWCTVYPKKYEADPSLLILQSDEEILSPGDLPDYKYTPLNDPSRDIRIIELLPGKFDDIIVVRIHHITLTPPPQWASTPRTTLSEIKKTLPPGWEAFQTIVDRRFFFRDMRTGKTQWEHPVSKILSRKTVVYEMPPKDASFPAYETLSYVWGPGDKSAAVTVDRPDVDGGLARLAVTESLITALRYLRYPTQKRNLWVDGICLNQTDNHELAQQVPRMGEIYSYAYTGTAWLGTEGDGSVKALETLQYLGDQVVGEGFTGLLFCGPNAKEPKWHDPDFPLPFSTETWDGIVALLRRPWFDRLWVVQELQPGAVLQCGYDKIPLTSFSEAEYCLYCKTNLPPGIRWRMTAVDGTMCRFWSMALPRLLYHAATYKQCTDPRDKIYGSLGLAPPKFAKSITVDYHKSNQASDVYKMAVLNHADITQRFEHFLNCFTPKEARKIPDGPSWVPDWFSECPGESYIPSQFVSTSSRAHWRHSKDQPNVLELLGVKFGNIIHVTEPLPQRLPGSKEAIRHVRRWQPDDLNTGTYKPTGEPLRKAYAITIICNGLREREPDWIVSSVDEWAQHDFDEGQRLLDAPGGQGTQDAESSQPVEPRPDVSDALQLCAERLFFRTDDGYIGLGPHNTQPGDIIAVPLGCPNALVLRPAAAGGSFSVVGECFVYGLHDAIALLGPLPSPWRGVAAWGHGDRRFINFVNVETGERTVEDPRLARSHVWERVEVTRPGQDEPVLFDFHRNKETGELINYDPRLEPEALEAKGVRLEWLSFV